MSVRLRHVVMDLEVAERKAYMEITNKIHDTKQQAHKYRLDQQVIRCGYSIAMNEGCSETLCVELDRYSG